MPAASPEPSAKTGGPTTEPVATSVDDQPQPHVADKDPAITHGSLLSSAPFKPGPALWGMAVLVALFLISTGVFIGTLLDGTKEETPASGPPRVDVGFLRDMQAHHTQAVEMAVLIRDRTDNGEIRQVALDIELTQQQQVGQMYGLLADWGQSQTNPNPMSWMSPASDTSDSHSGMSTMPGMASAADLERLASLRGTAAERLFLELMIAHHTGGIPMARAAAEDAEEPWVRTLAQSIVDAQSAEIAALQAMLDKRGGPTK